MAAGSAGASKGPKMTSTIRNTSTTRESTIQWRRHRPTGIYAGVVDGHPDIALSIQGAGDSWAAQVGARLPGGELREVAARMFDSFDGAFASFKPFVIDKYHRGEFNVAGLAVDGMEMALLRDLEDIHLAIVACDDVEAAAAAFSELVAKESLQYRLAIIAAIPDDHMRGLAVKLDTIWQGSTQLLIEAAALLSGGDRTVPVGAAVHERRATTFGSWTVLFEQRVASLAALLALGVEEASMVADFELLKAQYEAVVLACRDTALAEEALAGEPALV